MSYCRFSSDGFQCDVYVYADVSGGWTTHVAAKRHPNRVPDIDHRSEDTFKRSYAAHRAALDDPENAVVPIGRAADGASFHDATALDCAQRLLWLRGLGYNVPQYAIDELVEESKG